MNKVLIIDDEKSFHILAGEILKKSIPNCKLLYTKSGLEGIKIAQAEHPDTILLDIVMPDMNGYEVCEILKANKQTKNIPIVLTSIFEKDTKSRVKGLKSGADVFLSKPYDPSELSAQVASMLRIRKAEKAVKESEKRFENLADASMEAIFFSKNGFCLEANQVSAEMFGYDDPKEFIGIYGTDIIAPEGHDIVNEHMLKNTPGTYETIGVRKDGSQFPVSIRSKPMIYKDHGIIRITSINDITWRKQNEEEQNENEEKYRAIVENSHDAIYIYKDDKFLFINNKASELSGYTKDDFYEMVIWDMLHPDDKERVEEYGKSRALGKETSSNYSARLITKQGNIRYCEFSISTIPYKGDYATLGSVRDVTDGKKAEQEIRKLSKVVETSNQAVIITNLVGYITYVNPELLKLGKWDNENELTGKSVFAFTDQEGANQLRQEIIPAILQKGAYCSEMFLRRKDNSMFQAEINCSIILSNTGKPEYLVAMFSDISERKQTEKALKESELKFKEMADLLPVVVYEADLSGNFTFVNRQAFEMFGYENQKFMEGINVFSTIIPEDRDKVSEVLANIANKIIYKSTEYTAIRKDGSTFPAIIFSAPILKNEKLVGIRGALVNISEQKAAEQAIYQKNIELEQRNQELDEYSHTVAHDLKNPLNSVFGFSDLLKKEYEVLSKEDVKQYAGFINTSASNMVQIIETLLLLATVRKADIQTKKIYMGDIISDSINRMSDMINSSKAKITIAETLPAATGYGPWIEEVWVNYLGNALKYGGMPPHIEFGANSKTTNNTPQGMIRFWIKDKGPGISVENQKRLFKKFERLDHIKTEGHGLGLSIVRRIIEKLGGQVGVESELGKGSLFYFTLPA